MTREEAIEVLQTALTAPFIYGKYAEALDMAIESLSAEQKEKIFAIITTLKQEDNKNDR